MDLMISTLIPIPQKVRLRKNIGLPFGKPPLSYTYSADVFDIIFFFHFCSDFDETLHKGAGSEKMRRPQGYSI